MKCLNDGFVRLVDSMGTDASICNAARVSYGNHVRSSNNAEIAAKIIGLKLEEIVRVQQTSSGITVLLKNKTTTTIGKEEWLLYVQEMKVIKQGVRPASISAREWSEFLGKIQ